MAYRLGMDFPDHETGRQGSLVLSGGMWHGDVFLYDFSLAHFGLGGLIECDWRSDGPKVVLSQGDGDSPRTRAALTRIADVLRPFFRGTFVGLSDEQIAGLYPGTYHEGSGYTEPEPTPIEAEFKGAIADLVVRTLQPRKVIDAGCAAGGLVRELRNRGVEAFGFDVCPDLARIALTEVAAYLRRGFAWSIPFGPEDGFDTLVCIDMFEHVPEDRVPLMVREFERLGVQNLAIHISHTELEYHGHITLRPLTWWDEQLAPGFRRAQIPGSDLLQLPCPIDPLRVLRIYRRVGVPQVVLPSRRDSRAIPAAAIATT